MYEKERARESVCVSACGWVCMCVGVYVCVRTHVCVRSLKLQVSLAGFSLFYRGLLQKRPMNLSKCIRISQLAAKFTQ